LTVIVVSRDLLFASRVAAIALRADVAAERIDDLAEVVVEPGDIVVLEWDNRTPQWAGVLRAWASKAERDGPGPEVIAAVSHQDRVGIREAKAAGVRRVVARSGLPATLQSVLGVAPPASVTG